MLVPLCVGACVLEHGNSLVECVNAVLLLRHIKRDGFFGDVSTSSVVVDPIPVCKPLTTSEWTTFDPSCNTDQGV